MAKLGLYFIALVLCVIALPFLAASSGPFVLVSGIIIGLAGPFLDGVISNVRYLRLIWYGIRYRNARIRVSVSYLFRIKVDGRYLLIRGGRWPQFQPVGGVYKVLPEARGVLNDLHALDDDLVAVDAVSRNDLRIRIPANRLVTFMRWFESERSRETSPWREFYEELVEPGIVPSEQFPYVFANFIRRDVRPIRFSQYARSMELLIADIYELHPNEVQLSALRSLQHQDCTNIYWATEDQIRRMGAIPGKNQEIVIGTPAAWTL